MRSWLRPCSVQYNAVNAQILSNKNVHQNVKKRRPNLLRQPETVLIVISVPFFADCHDINEKYYCCRRSHESFIV